MKRLVLFFMAIFWFATARADIAADLYKEGVKLGNENKIEEALVKFQRAVALEPKKFLYVLKLSFAYELLGRLPEARASYEAALELNPGSAEAHAGLAKVLRKTRLFDLAEKEFQKALKLKPKYAEAMAGLAVLYAEREELDKAAEMYVKAFKTDPKDYESAFKAANVYWRQKKYDDAITFYKKALEVKPDYVDAHFGLGLTLKEKGDTEAAKEALRKACDGGVKQACKHLFQM